MVVEAVVDGALAVEGDVLGAVHEAVSRAPSSQQRSEVRFMGEA
jgi:hypothetical protein